jgi:hypothetical protein
MTEKRETKMETINGMVKDAAGRLVPIEMVKPADAQRDDLVRRLFKKYGELQELCQMFRACADSEIDAHLQLVQEIYGVKKGGQEGNLTLTTYDGEMRVLRAVDKVLAFSDEIHAAKTLIFECVHEWTEGARVELRALVENAFRQDKQGHLSADRILGLLRLDIQDERWLRAMQAIKDSVRVQSTRTYLRFYRRTPDGQYSHIPSGV